MCRPNFLPVKDGHGVIDFRDLRHPMINSAAKGLEEEKPFIPNDTKINSRRSLLLVTGPNMGGKSTLLR